MDDVTNSISHVVRIVSRFAATGSWKRSSRHFALHFAVFIARPNKFSVCVSFFVFWPTRHQPTLSVDFEASSFSSFLISSSSFRSFHIIRTLPMKHAASSV